MFFMVLENIDIDANNIERRPVRKGKEKRKFIRSIECRRK
jgi:hypothetical protein